MRNQPITKLNTVMLSLHVNFYIIQLAIKLILTYLLCIRTRVSNKREGEYLMLNRPK